MQMHERQDWNVDFYRYRIGYDSKTLTGSYEKYHSSMLEFLPLKWAIYDHFKNYLFYSPHFEVYADFNKLTCIETGCKVNAPGQR